MLSAADNRYVSSTGPTTPMGELFRRFWLPALLPEELPEADGRPVRLRLLDEPLVAFRESSGQVGIVAENCPHRGASLYFGRNEEAGLRCVYHGWKFDVSGACVEMPNEPAESNFREKVRARAYPVREWGGVVWVYMGPEERMGELPQFEWARVPSDHRYIGKYVVEANYLQVIEGSVDSAHLGFLHTWLDQSVDLQGRPREQSIPRIDKTPRFLTQDTEYGLTIAARRDAPEDSYYWRLTQMLLPSWAMIPATPGGNLSIVGTVPIDDISCLCWKIVWSTGKPFTAEQIAEARNASDWSGSRTGQGPGSARTNIGISYPLLEPGTFKCVANARNDYLRDYEVQRTKTFTGIPGVSEQDLAVQESMGPVCDRTHEHLGASDLGVIATRKRLMRAAEELQAGVEPYAATNADVFHVRSVAQTLKREESYEDAPQIREAMIARF